MSSSYKALYNETDITADVINVNNANITNLQCDTITESTPDNGVDVEGVHMEDNVLSVDTITEKTTDNGVNIEGVKLKDGKLNDTSYTEGILLSDSNGEITSSYSIPSTLTTQSLIPISSNTYELASLSSPFANGYLSNLNTNQISDMNSPIFYKIIMDSDSNRIRFCVGGEYVDIVFDSTAHISTPNIFISSCLTNGIAHFVESTGRLQSS